MLHIIFWAMRKSGMNSKNSTGSIMFIETPHDDEILFPLSITRRV